MTITLPRIGLGVEFPTRWARRRPARMLRAVMINVITKPVIGLIAKPRVIGAHRILRSEQPLIFAANHSSHLDTSVLLTAMPAVIRRRCLVAARSDYFFDKLWKATLWTLWINTVPIDREKVSRKTIRHIADLVDDDWHLLIYPEASRGDDDFVDPFRAGAAYLATHTRAMVVPTHIEGTRRIFPPYMRRLRPGRTRVVFGEPIAPLVGEKAREFNLRIQRGVEAAADEGRTDWWSAKRRAVLGRTPSLGPPDGLLDGWRRAWAANKSLQRDTANRWPF